MLHKICKNLVAEYIYGLSSAVQQIHRYNFLTFHLETPGGFQTACLSIPVGRLQSSDKIKSRDLTSVTNTRRPHWIQTSNKVSHLELASCEAVNGVLFLLCAVGGMLPLRSARGHMPIIGAGAVPYSAPSRRQIWVLLQSLIIPDVIFKEDEEKTA